MNTLNIMEDPYYAPILHAIEFKIVAASRAAAAQGISLTDSQVRSIVHKVRQHKKGAVPKEPADSPREKTLHALHLALLAIPSELMNVDEGDAPSSTALGHFLLAVRTVEASIRNHSSGAGSRAYLEFVAGFLPDAQ